MIEYELVKTEEDKELSAEDFQRLRRENRMINPDDLPPVERMEYFRELAELEAEDPPQQHIPEADIPEANRAFNESRKPKLDDDPPVTKMLLKVFGFKKADKKRGEDWWWNMVDIFDDNSLSLDEQDKAFDDAGVTDEEHEEIMNRSAAHFEDEGEGRKQGGYGAEEKSRSQSSTISPERQTLHDKVKLWGRGMGWTEGQIKNTIRDFTDTSKHKDLRREFVEGQSLIIGNKPNEFRSNEPPDAQGKLPKTEATGQHVIDSLRNTLLGGGQRLEGQGSVRDMQAGWSKVQPPTEQQFKDQPELRNMVKMNVFKMFGIRKATSDDILEEDTPKKYSEAWWRKVDDIFEVAGQMGDDMTDERVGELLDAIGFDINSGDDYDRMERGDRAIDTDDIMEQELTRQGLQERSKEMLETSAPTPPTGYTGNVGLPPAWNEQAGERRRGVVRDSGERFRERATMNVEGESQFDPDKPWHTLPKKEDYASKVYQILENVRQASGLRARGGQDLGPEAKAEALDYVGEGSMLDRLEQHEDNLENIKTVESHIPQGGRDIYSKLVDPLHRKPYVDPVSGVEYAWPDMQNMTKMQQLKTFMGR